MQETKKALFLWLFLDNFEQDKKQKRGKYESNFEAQTTERRAAIAVYLDCYHKGERRYEYLGLYLTGNKQSDKEILATCPEPSAQSESWKWQAVSLALMTKFKQESNLYEFLERFAETKPKRIGVYRQCKRHLLKFTEKEVLRFSDVTPLFLEQWKAYLLICDYQQHCQRAFFLPESSSETSRQRENHFQESLSWKLSRQKP
jgi:hypothetical protein